MMEKSNNRTDARRERQLSDLIAAAEELVALHGPDGLKMRELASRIGIALGAVYNLVGDRDELIHRVATNTLVKLDAVLSENLGGRQGRNDQAVGRLVEIAIAYRRFASEHTNLWRLLFEYRLPDGKEMPSLFVEQQSKLFLHITGPLASLMPHADETELSLTSRTMFSAVHGVVLLGLEEKLVAVPINALDDELERLVRLICKGLMG
jgi:AcrR family transcriptional regulator